MKIKNYFLTFIILFIVSAPIFESLAQPQGKLIIQNFNIDEIGSRTGSFWAIIKDKRGVVYAGGEEAIFEFDGTNWRSIKLPNKSVVRSLAINDDGIIFAGGVSELGYLAPDSKGLLQFVSLLDKVPAKYINFPDVWSTNIIGDTVYFQTADNIFVYKNDEITVIEVQDTYHRSFTLDDKLILNQHQIGLSYINNNKAELLPEGDFFAGKTISSITRYKENKYLIGTRREGLFIYDPYATKGNRINVFNSKASEFLIEYQLYHGIELPENQYAFSSTQNGTIIINQQGEILKIINKNTGSIDFNAYFLYLDKKTELWITSASGISLYNLNSALTYWNDDMGLRGTVNSVISYQDKIYAGTIAGLFYLDMKPDKTGTNQPADFKHVEGIDSEVWDFLIFKPDKNNNSDGVLLATTHEGLYNVTQKKLEFKTNRVGQLTMFHSKQNPSLIYLNAHPYFYILQYHEQKWVKLYEKQISNYIISIVEDANGNVWIGTRFYGVFLVELEPFFKSREFRDANPISTSAFKNVTIRNFNTSDGLPDLGFAMTHLYHENLLVTCKGMFVFDSKVNKFLKTNQFGETTADWDNNIEGFKEDIFGNIWGVRNQILDKQGDGSFHLIKLPYKMLTLNNSAVNFFHQQNGSTWIVGQYNLMMYNNKIIKSIASIDFTPLIREVSYAGDSLLYGGAYTMVPNGDTIRSGKKINSKAPSIPYKSRLIRFEFSSPYFNDDIQPEYSFFLEGFDNTWSEWSTSSFKEYTNLQENNYAFKVRARNYSGQLSDEAVYSFIISPPWYRTVIAYILYTVIFILLLYVTLVLYSKRLKSYNLHLEELVRARTSELQNQKEEINIQADKLKIQNDKLVQQRDRMSEMSKELINTNRDKMKFFTNISHELRTPLTLILGPVEDVLANSNKLSKEQLNNKFNTVHRNARRLLALVNQILDFRKLEISRPRLKASEDDIVTFTNEIASCFKELAEKKNINLIFNAEKKEIKTWFDPDNLGKILFNLISNAFKFTDKGGKVTISIFLKQESTASNNDKQNIEIVIADTGIGIREDLIPKIFDRYTYSGNSLSLEQAGSGIGLSMASSLAEIHHGKISVQSVVGKGSEFKLTIPYGESYLREIEKDINADGHMFKILREKARMEVSNHINTEYTRDKTVASTTSGRELILIVEDSSDLRDYLKSEIEKKYDVIEAENGVEALALAIEFNPRIIISDIMMPEMNGYELCTKIKSTIEISHIPVILLTAKASDEDKKHGYSVGADAYIPKPFNMEMLMGRIENLILSSDRMREKFSKNLMYNSGDISITPSDEIFITKALKIVETNVAKINFGVDEFAQEMAMSQSTLYRKLKALSGESTNNFIKDFRLNFAANILTKNDLPINEVALMVGFDDPAYFAKSFKIKYGQSPTEYMKEKKA